MDAVGGVKSADLSMFTDPEIISRQGKRKAKSYCNIVCAFDIETTLIDSIRQSVMYIWQFQIEDQTTIIGRTWEEFRLLLKRISETIPEGSCVVIYVHNLSYEFQFIKSQIPIDSVFAMDNRKILTVESGPFEFRCSYLLSNMSLEKFVISAGGRYRKQEGFDYSKKRYAWTPLTEEEMKYCIYDVKALTDAVRHKMQMDHDTLLSIPRTSTGYVRRIFKEIMRPYGKMVKWELPDLDVFQGLRKAFRGGDTHANRYNTQVIIRDVHSYDISSSYPSALIGELYPGRFERADPDHLQELIRRNYALLIHLNLYEVHLIREEWGAPYIPKAKCGRVLNGVYDNGRVLSAEVISELWITEIDFKIICDQYDFEYEIVDLFASQKKKLPRPFRDQLIHLYRQKTELKGIDDYAYSKAKNQFNSAYGMSVQNPCKPDYKYDPDTKTVELDDTKTMQELIDEYHVKGWLPYQIGVWCTSYARAKLQEGISLIDPDRFVYCDTDSVKVIGNADKEFKRLNRKYINKRWSAVDPSGERHYLGIFEKDAHYQKFITMGAKKYAYVDDAGEMHVTISGVNKKAGAEELGCIENFREGFVFRTAGGLEAVYNDDPEVKEITIDGHHVDISSNVALCPSTYTLGIAPDYRELLNFLMNTDIRYSLHYER